MPASNIDDSPIFTGLARELHEMTLEDIAQGKAREAISGISDVVRGTGSAIPPAGDAKLNAYRAQVESDRQAGYTGPVLDVINRAGKSRLLNNAPLWSPYEISLLLWISPREGLDEKHPSAGLDLYRETLDKFGQQGLLDRIKADGSVVLSAKGRAFINMLLSTPLPVLQIVDPRTGAVVL